MVKNVLYMMSNLISSDYLGFELCEAKTNNLR